MSELLIIGYGNPLRGDDGFGYHAAERLQKVLIDDRDVTVLPLHQLTPELAADIARTERVVFIDAAADGETGKLNCRAVAKAAFEAGAFTHHVTPGGLLGAAETLYGHAPEAVLNSVAGQSFELSEKLTAAVAEALGRVVEEVASSRLAAR